MYVIVGTNTCTAFTDPNNIGMKIEDSMVALNVHRAVVKILKVPAWKKNSLSDGHFKLRKNLLL